METIEKLFKKLSPYIIVIFLTVHIHNFIVTTSGNTTFVNNFNFASTITSIILSVVAIMYTLIEGAQSKIAQSNIEKASEEVKKSVIELKGVTQYMKEMKNKLNELETNIMENNSELVNSIIEKSYNRTEVDDSKPISGQLSNILDGFAIDSLRNCLLFYKSYELKKDLDINRFNKYYNKHLSRALLPTHNITDGVFKTLEFLSSLGCIEYTYDLKKLKIVDFSEDLKEALFERIPHEDEYSDMQDGLYFGTVYDFFRNVV